MPTRETRTSDTLGRPRSEQAQQAVLTAARSLFEEGGYTAATVEGVAARSGVAKTTIYRRWPNRAVLLVDVLVREADLSVPPPSGGDPLRAIRGELRRGAVVANGFIGRLLTSLLGAAQEDPEVRAALLEGLFYPRREASAEAIKRAQVAGVLRADVPPHIVTDLLFGPLFFRMFVQHEPVTVTFVDQVYQYVMQGLQPPGTRRK